MDGPVWPVDVIPERVADRERGEDGAGADQHPEPDVVPIDPAPAPGRHRHRRGRNRSRTPDTGSVVGADALDRSELAGPADAGAIVGPDGRHHRVGARDADSGAVAGTDPACSCRGGQDERCACDDHACREEDRSPHFCPFHRSKGRRGKSTGRVDSRNRQARSDQPTFAPLNEVNVQPREAAAIGRHVYRAYAETTYRHRGAGPPPRPRSRARLTRR